MTSRGKKKTTFAKIAREQRQRERRTDKEARKAERRRHAELEFSAAPTEPDAELTNHPEPEPAVYRSQVA